MFVLMPGRPARRSVNRFGPSKSSRTTSSVQRSPTMSSPCAVPHASWYLRQPGSSVLSFTFAVAMHGSLPRAVRNNNCIE